jgi:DNA (cytosine-5)-methyltransferase 1
MDLLQNEKLKMMDLFSGTGAFSLAFHNTNKVETVFANDLLDSSEEIFNLNNSLRLTKKPLNEIPDGDIPKSHIITAGFPCFVAGTKTLTNNGYKNIEDVEITDRLLTHNGKFQKIINLQRKIYTGNLFDIKIKYHPELITTTEEHPFYIREKKGNIFGKAIWKKANELTMNDYFGMVINDNDIIPEFTFENQYIKLNKLDYWFVMGYLMSDGWIEKDGQYIEFNIDPKDEEVFQKINKVVPIMPYTGDKTFGCSDYTLYNILKQFAHGKIIPEWVQDAPKEFIQEFINGYMKANNNKNITVAYGIQRLHLKLRQIEGKTDTQNIYEDNYVWFAPMNIAKREITAEIPVYNFEVENDNSYIVMNTVVHNCQPFSIAGMQKGFEDERSNVFWKILSIIRSHSPEIVILENVKNLQSHDKGKTFQTIIENITNIGYHIKYSVLNTSKITGIPQNRERIYIVCFLNRDLHDKFHFDFPEQELMPVAEFLESDIPAKYYYSDSTCIFEELKKNVTKNVSTNTIYQYRRYYVRENKNNVCPTLTANMGTGGHNVPIILDDRGIRKLTPRECFNLQGFPRDYLLPETLSSSKLYSLAGNAVSVPVVSLIANRIAENI